MIFIEMGPSCSAAHSGLSGWQSRQYLLLLYSRDKIG
jgi:hypothetical protein